jgi:hypothetical protein
MTPDVFSMDVDSQTALQEIGVALDEFANYYEDDVLHSPTVDIAVQDCKPFKKYQFYNNLLYMWNHIYRHHEKGSEARNDVSIKSLNDVLF